MLQFELSKKGAGIILWGDTWTLQALHEFVHRVNEESPLLSDKEGFFLGLAYDIRKAYEGQREKSTIKSFDDVCPIWGVKILWPTLVAQVGILRHSMAFIPTRRHEQAMMYELESIIEGAARAFLPGMEEVVMELVQRVGTEYDYVQKVLSTRCCYYLGLSPRERKKKFLCLLNSLVRTYEMLVGVWQRSGVDVIPLNDFERYESYGWDLPDFQW